MLLILHPSRRLSFLVSTVRHMGSNSKHLLKTTNLPVSLHPKSPPLRLLRASRRLCPSFSSKPISRTRPVFCLQTNGLSYTSVRYEDSEQEENGQVQITRLPKSAKLSRRMEELGIHIDSCLSGQYNNLLCPMCNGGDSMEKSLSVFIEQDWDSASWLCFRAKCGWKGRTKASTDSSKPSNGSLKPMIKQKKIIRKISEEGLGLEPLSDEVLGYFALRSISKETLKRHLVMQTRNYDGQAGIAFTYRRNGELISAKYRGTTKSFWVEKDTEKIFYGLDDIEGETDIIIVEGEMDKLAMAEAGFHNCVSVPDGATSSVSQKEVPPEDQDTKYQYLWNCKEYLKKASRIIIATDGDSPGKALAEELARRIGRERCWRVKWPEKNEAERFLDANEAERFKAAIEVERFKDANEVERFKDANEVERFKDANEVERFKNANEVLMFLGPDGLKEAIDNAELYPIRGLFNFRDYFNEIDAFYHRTHDSDFGISTGWKSLNSLYNVVPGELTIVTGVPNSGKSEWIDALLCNLNETADWKFALCSMENKVRDHARKLLEKRIKKPFFDERYGESIERMSVEELEEGKQWLSDTFSLIRCEDDSLPSIKWVLDLAKAAVLRHGVRGLVIDPYNELDHQRPTSQTETEYVSQMLTKVKRFAQHHSCHVWFVAHPRQLHQWNGGPPNLYDISGSAHFINKCDNGLVIHRNRDPSVGPIDQVQVCVRKVRNKVIGTIGEAFLSYDRTTGLYSDVDDITCT